MATHARLHAAEHISGPDPIQDATNSQKGLATAAQITALEANTASRLYSDTVVNLDSSMTAVQIQALIDAQPKNLGGFKLTFQFANGTYTLNAGLTFQDFYGGNIVLDGDASQGFTPRTDQNVVLDFTGSGGDIYVQRCKRLDLYRMKVIVDFTGITAQNTTTQIYACYFEAASTGVGYGIWADLGSNVYANNNYVSDLANAAYAQRAANCQFANMYSTGTDCVNGYTADGCNIQVAGVGITVSGTLYAVANNGDVNDRAEFSPYDNSASGLTADDVQAAIDEVVAKRRIITPTDDLAAIVNAATGDDEFILTEGTHVVTDAITISGKDNITLRGSRAAILDVDLTASAVDLFTITDSSDIVLEGFTIEALLNAGGGQSVVRYVNVASHMLRNCVLGILCTIETNNARFVYQDTGTAGFDCDDFRIEDNEVTGVVLDGVYMDSGSDTSEYKRWRVAGNKFFSSYASAGYGVYLDCGNPDKSTPSITQNFIDSFTTGIYTRRGKSGRIESNSVFNTLSGAGFDIQVVDGRESTIKDNICKNGAGAGAISADGWHCAIEGNNIRDCAGYGITSSALRGLVSDNVIYNPGSHGIRATEDDMVVADNVINDVSKTASIYGIETTGDDLAVSGNFVDGGAVGFRINGGDRGTFTGNHSNDALTYGFHLTGAATNHVLNGCHAEGCDSDGFRVDSNENMFVGCHAKSSGNDGFACNEKRCQFIGCRSEDSGGDGFSMGVNSRRMLFSGCYALNNTGWGWVGTGHQESELVGCRAYFNGAGGIRVSGNSSIVNACHCEANTGVGIMLNGSDYSTVTGNNCLLNTSHGIHLDESDGCLVNSNRCFTNTGDGIREDADCDANKFADNYASANTGDDYSFSGTNPEGAAVFKSATHTTGPTGSHYTHGYYEAPAADANLTQASPTQTYGIADRAYGAHAFLVAAAAGAASGGAGAVEIEVSGTSVTDAGVRTPADTEIIVADITAMATDQYFETAKKWIGTVTFTLQNAGGSTQTTFNADFNYGFCKYEDFGNRNFRVTDFEVVGTGGATDTGFDIELLHHKATGWTYNATAFVPGSDKICQMTTDYVTETDLSNNVPFAYKRAALSTSVAGGGSEGVVVRLTTGAVNSVENCDIHVGVQL